MASMANRPLFTSWSKAGGEHHMYTSVFVAHSLEDWKGDKVRSNPSKAIGCSQVVLWLFLHGFALRERSQTSSEREKPCDLAVAGRPFQVALDAALLQLSLPELVPNALLRLDDDVAPAQDVPRLLQQT